MYLLFFIFRFTPPSCVFPVVWPILYLMIGYAIHLVWEVPGFHNIYNVLSQAILIGLNLLLNYSWSFIFFRRHNLKLSFFCIIGILLTGAASIVSFRLVNGLAGIYLIPYIIWVLFATMLNYRIWKDNKPLKLNISKKNK